MKFEGKRWIGKARGEKQCTINSPGEERGKEAVHVEEVEGAAEDANGRRKRTLEERRKE